MKDKAIISLSAIKKLLKKVGSERIGREACIELRKALEEYAILLGRLAVKNAMYEGRKSVKGKDIKEAISEVKKEEDHTNI